jgi:hypothetical protein
MTPGGLIAIVYKRLLQLGKVAGALTFLFGIPYGIEQYLEKQHDGRVSETLALYNQFNGAPFSTYRENITKAIVGNDAAITKAAGQDADHLSDVVIDMVKKTGIEADLLMTMDFFDAVATCVEKSLCDRDTAQRLFSPRARDLLVIFYQYMQVRRVASAGPDFGIGLEVMARMKPNKQNPSRLAKAARWVCQRL